LYLKVQLSQGEGIVGLSTFEEVSESTLTKMLGAVSAVTNALTEKKAQHLHNIKHSVR